MLTLAALRSQPRREVEITMECSGNPGLPFFTGGVSTARWGGVQLRRLLRGGPAGGRGRGRLLGRRPRPGDDPRRLGRVSGGRSGTLAEGALTITERFARSMTLEEAMAPDNLVAYEMNGAPLPPEHGFPARLIAPGWYGVANVKWLTRIELQSERYAGRFMARDYVTIREESAAATPSGPSPPSARTG